MLAVKLVCDVGVGRFGSPSAQQVMLPLALATLKSVPISGD